LANAEYCSRALARGTNFYFHLWRDVGPERRYFEARATTIFFKKRCIRSSTVQVLKAWRARAVEGPLLSTGPRGIFGEGSQEQGLFTLQYRLRALVKVRQMCRNLLLSCFIFFLCAPGERGWRTYFRMSPSRPLSPFPSLPVSLTFLPSFSLTRTSTHSPYVLCVHQRSVMDAWNETVLKAKGRRRSLLACFSTF